MDPTTLRTAVAELSSERLRSLCSSKSGKHWVTVLGAFKDCDIDGSILCDYVESAGTVHAFLHDHLGVEVPKVIALALRKILVEHAATASAPEDNASRGGGDGEGGGRKARAPGVATARNATPGVGREPQHARVSLCVNVDDTTCSAGDGGGRSAGGGGAVRGPGTPRKITLDIPAKAAVSTVQRLLLERLQKSLQTAVILAHAGRHLEAEMPVPDWANLSFVHAILLDETVNLTIENAANHPIVIKSVVLDSKPEAAPLARSAPPPTLHIFDSGIAMGHGAFGAVYKGSVEGLHSQRPVAVKKFFMLENPPMYGLDASAMHAWVNLDLLPEVNILARLAHPNVVRMRCVGLQEVLGAVVPAFVAMDFCNSGTLEEWIKLDKLTSVCVVGFMRDLIAAMHYLHNEARVVHRDLKPDNLFVHQLASQPQPMLVVGDVGLSKQVARTVSLVSAAGAAAYRAPEAMADVSRCSTASDVYSASLVAVELAIRKQVYSETNGDSSKKKSLIDEAQASMASILAFADDSELTVEAANMLLRACSIVDPDSRPSFRAIVAACDRGIFPTVKSERAGVARKTPEILAKCTKLVLLLLACCCQRTMGL